MGTAPGHELRPTFIALSSTGSELGGAILQAYVLTMVGHEYN